MQIDPGTPAAGELGDAVLGADRTTTVVDIVDVVDTFDDETRRALHTALLEVGTGAAGRGPDLNDLIAASPDLLADLNLTGRTLTAEETRLVAFLATAERLSGRFNGREAATRGAHPPDGRHAAGGGHRRRAGPWPTPVKKLPSTLDALTPALSDLEAAAAALGPAVHDLGPSAAALGAVTVTPTSGPRCGRASPSSARCRRSAGSPARRCSP